jgi:hypothetical protein
MLFSATAVGFLAWDQTICLGDRLRSSKAWFEQILSVTKIEADAKGSRIF